MADKLVTIAQFADSIEANLALQRLADFGIKAVLTGQHAANVYGGIPALGAIKLQTLQSKAEQALEILESENQQEQ
ncbi:MAG: putative signal transducing protein [Planctomycetota bacterium]|jgi:hypothetical protein